MSEKDHHRDTYGPAFWLAAGVGSAMLAGQLVLRAMRAMHHAGSPAGIMKGPFGAAGWMFGQTGAVDDAPEPPVAPKAKPAPRARAKAEVSEAEVVAEAPEAAPVVPNPVEVAAAAAKAAEPVIEAIRETLAKVSETLAEVTPAAPEGEVQAEEPAALAEALEPESAPVEAAAEPEAEVAPEPEAEIVAEPEAETAQEPEAKADAAPVNPPVDPARPTALAAPRGAADDLRRIKGIGPKLAGVLNGLGYYHFDQIAAWGPEEIAVVDESLGTFAGRALRDDWIGQAKALAAGEMAGDKTAD